MAHNSFYEYCHLFHLKHTAVERNENVYQLMKSFVHIIFMKTKKDWKINVQFAQVTSTRTE